MDPIRIRSLLAGALGLMGLAMMAPMGEARAAEPQLSHAVFFTTKDRSPAGREKVLALCEKYLSGHRGTVSFTVGTIAEDVKEPVSDREFDVALIVVFEDKAMLAEYLKSPRHDKFVAEGKDLWAKVRVFDSYLPMPKVSAAR